MNILSIIYLLISLMLYYIIGWSITHLFKAINTAHIFYNVFVRLLIGLVIVLTVYAFIKTSGHTICCGFIVVGILYIISYINHNREQFVTFRSITIGNECIAIGVVLVLGVLFYCYQGCFFYHNICNNIPHGDYSGYATIQGILNSYGIESYAWQNVALEHGTLPTPYHYFDLWLPSMYVFLFNIPVYEAQVIISQSILMAILSVGMIALTRQFTHNKLIQGLSILSIFFSGLLFYKVLPQSSDFIFSNSCSLKYLSVGIFLLLTCIKIVRKEDDYYYPLLCLPILNIITIPSVLGSIFLILLVQCIRKELSVKIAIIILLKFLIIVLFIGAFYCLQSSGNNDTWKLLSGTLYYNVLQPLKPLKILAGSLLILVSIYFCYFIPYIICIIKEHGKICLNNTVLCTFSVSIPIVGLLAWSYTNILADSMQFFAVTGIIVINMLIWITIMKCYVKCNKTGKILLGIYIVVLFIINIWRLHDVPFYRYTKVENANYVLAVSSAMNECHAVKGMYCNDSSEMVSYWSYNDFGYGNLMKPFVKELYIPKVYPAHSIEHFNEIEQLRIKNAIAKTAFAHFIQENTSISNYDSLQYLFAKQINADFIMLSKKSTLSPMFTPYIDTIYTDKISGERCVMLKSLH